MSDILFLEPVFKETIWGGKALKEKYGFDIPSDKTGECWCISAHKHGDNKILNGRFKGQTLSQVYQEHRELFENCTSPVFPILVKFIDANDNLSVQVHPDDDYAHEKEQTLGKNECWYILDAKKDTKLVMGHNAKDLNDLKQYIENGHWDQLLKEVPVKQGDFFYIPSGTVHAICTNNLIYEVQQSSDITYRLYDYNRVDDYGNQRELHLDKAMDVITYKQNQNVTPIKINDIQTNLLNCKYFSVSKFDLKDRYSFKNEGRFRLISIIDGEGTVNDMPVKKADSFIILSNVDEVCFKGKMTYIETMLGE